jgi:hypothetical protein
MLEKTESLIKSAESKKAANEWGLARVDYLEAYDLLKKADKSDAKIQKYLTDVEKELTVVNNELAKLQYQKGKTAVENGLWKIAIDSLEEATRLANIEDVAFLEEIKVWLDKAKVSERDAEIRANAEPFISRGDDFKRNGNYGEAVLEYQAAAKVVENMPENHPYYIYVNNQLLECRRCIARPYLKKAYRAVHAKHFIKASSLLKRALFIVDSKDNIYHDFISKMLEKAEANLSEKELSDSEDNESQELWEKTIKDYEEALNLYSSYTVTDPFAPAYTGVNIYEDKFAESRRRLGRLYKMRADRLRNNGKVEKAIHNYKEAIKLLPKTDKLFFEAFSEMKKLRIQVTIPENK